MKRINFLIAILTVAIVTAISSCDSNKQKPGKIYIPDMTYSRAVESYSLLDSAVFTDNPDHLGKEIFYNRKPVLGTIAFNDSFRPYTLPNDSAGYALSAGVKNPLGDFLNGKDSKEAGRLFNINCAICHGADGKADGPLATSGKIGGVANLTTEAYIKMADGTMFHSIYYGKNNMGSYASQLSRKQRWMIVQYIRTLQPKATAIAAAVKSDSTTAK